MIENYAFLKVMEEVLGNASARYSVTEAAKKSGVSIFAAKHALDDLYTKGMISLEKIGRTYQYQADLGSYLTRQWKITFMVEGIKKHFVGLLRTTINRCLKHRESPTGHDGTGVCRPNPEIHRSARNT